MFELFFSVAIFMVFQHFGYFGSIAMSMFFYLRRVLRLKCLYLFHARGRINVKCQEFVLKCLVKNNSLGKITFNAHTPNILCCFAF